MLYPIIKKIIFSWPIRLKPKTSLLQLTYPVCDNSGVKWITLEAYVLVPSLLQTAHGGTKVAAKGRTTVPSKAPAKRGNMLPETFTADTCFLDVSQFCHTGNIVSYSKTCFCFTAETFFASGNSVFSCGKTGKHWGNMCPQQIAWLDCFSVTESPKTAWSDKNASRRICTKIARI